MNDTNLVKIKDLLAAGEFRFVSFKYLDQAGDLKQFDISAQSFLKNGMKDTPVCNHLELFSNGAFADPFRSHNTLSVFGALSGSVCDKTKQGLSDIEELSNLSAAVSFWVHDNELDWAPPALHQSDPGDIYANLRSEITLLLENIGFQMGVHYHGASQGESVVTLCASRACELAENLVITHFVIANCASSYGVRASLCHEELPNISLTCNVAKKNISVDKKLQVKSEKELYSLIYQACNE